MSLLQTTLEKSLRYVQYIIRHVIFSYSLASAVLLHSRILCLTSIMFTKSRKVPSLAPPLPLSPSPPLPLPLPFSSYQWFGHYLATLNPASFCFFLATFGNLVPRALAYHRDYTAKFKNYPKHRKAVIPFVL